MSSYGAASDSTCLKKRTAAEKVQVLSSGTTERASKGTFGQDITTKCQIKSSLRAALGWNNDQPWSALPVADGRGGAR